MLAERPPSAPAGAEYAPVPPGAQAWMWQPMVSAWGVRRVLAPLEGAGPHGSPGLPETRWIVADLTDPDTALMVLRRMCALPGAAVRSFTMVSLVVSGRWSARAASELASLCARTWGPRGGADGEGA